MQISKHDLLTCRILGLAQGYQRSSSAAMSQHLSSSATLDAAATRSQQGSSTTSQSASRLGSRRPAAADPSSNSSAAALGAASEQEFSTGNSSRDTQGASAEASAKAADQITAGHSVSSKDALHASRTVAKEWAAGRLSLDYPPDEDDDVDSMRRKPLPDQGSMQGASPAAVLHSVLSSLQQV